MSKMRLPFLFIFLAALTVAACSGKRENLIAQSTGKTAEVLVVIEDEYWESRTGDLIREVFMQESGGLPQPEALFSVLRINRKALDEIYRKHHNILVVSINNQYKESKVLTKDDYWASPQRVINIEAPSAEAFEAAFTERQASILELMRDAERKRLQKILTALQEHKLNNEIYELMKDKAHHTCRFFMASKGEGVIWLRKETKDFSQGILIYTTPYTDTTLFDPERIVTRRNEMCMKYIPAQRRILYVDGRGYCPGITKAIV